jgi:hypothetical protein
MFCDIAMEYLAASMLYDKKAIQDPKGGCGHCKEVHGSDDLPVVAKKSCPKFSGLIGRRQTAKIARHGSLRHFKSELKKLSMNSRSAPNGIFFRHLPDCRS